MSIGPGELNGSTLGTAMARTRRLHGRLAFTWLAYVASKRLVHHESCFPSFTIPRRAFSSSPVDWVGSVGVFRETELIDLLILCFFSAVV